MDSDEVDKQILIVFPEEFHLSILLPGMKAGPSQAINPLPSPRTYNDNN